MAPHRRFGGSGVAEIFIFLSRNKKCTLFVKEIFFYLARPKRYEVDQFFAQNVPCSFFASLYIIIITSELLEQNSAMGKFFEWRKQQGRVNYFRFSSKVKCWAYRQVSWGYKKTHRSDIDHIGNWINAWCKSTKTNWPFINWGARNIIAFQEIACNLLILEMIEKKVAKKRHLSRDLSAIIHVL